MNVASLELCQELYRHSRWNHTDYLWVAPPLTNSYAPMHNDELHRRNDDLALGGRSSKIHNSTFAYDLGYLLRKLPRWDKEGNEFTVSRAGDEGVNKWQVGYVGAGSEFYSILGSADTPEDAAAKLAIELFKQGILTRDGDE